ncbi:lysophospholipid acyltransferase family protein [Candidatus Protochlamydia phocaeensis]|uniref:lysophospholipid acyltransferase family protein n=1 Tax=Candidatus Protochlamydia phocaeensis TaxID=1414722 RepID=UPI0008396331|nr:lysophospholipid acyltransferase family protein [Candidatus Protochlamydia phocaeensis]
MHILYWIVLYCAKGYFKLFHRCRIYGKQNIVPGSAILAPNHTSFFDPPLIGACCPEEVHYLARASLFRHFLFGWFLKHLNAHPVHGSAQDIYSFKIICQLLSEGKKVVIFPEGIRSEDGTLNPIKSGIAMLALRMHCPIIPIYISGTFEAWPRQRRFPKIGPPITCVFGSPILVDAYLHLNKKDAQEQLTKRVQQSIGELRNWLEAGAKE